jgi:hypothetical protein
MAKASDNGAVDVEVLSRDHIIEGLRPLASPVALLDEWKDNYHEGNVPDVKRSYETFGQRKPIVARRIADGRGEVIAGNTQLRAARELGWDELAVVWVDDDDATAIAFAITDNHTAETGKSDDDLLIAALDVIKFDEALLRATAYSDDDIRELLATTGRTAEEEARFLAGLTDASGAEPPRGAALAVSDGAQLIFTFGSREDRERVTEALRRHMAFASLPTLTSALLSLCDAALAAATAGG